MPHQQQTREGILLSETELIAILALGRGRKEKRSIQSWEDNTGSIQPHSVRGSESPINNTGSRENTTKEVKAVIHLKRVRFPCGWWGPQHAKIHISNNEHAIRTTLRFFCKQPSEIWYFSSARPTTTLSISRFPKFPPRPLYLILTCSSLIFKVKSPSSN